MAIQNTTSIDRVRWGKYSSFEGPWHPGAHPWTLPDDPTIEDKFVAVITATEGGNYSTVNMYDRMIVSVGAIQWAECGQFSVSDLLGCVADRLGAEYVESKLERGLDGTGATFAKNKSGKWRFFLAGGGEVNTIEWQRMLWLGGKGTIGSWDDASRLRAKTWAACLVDVWDDPRARAVQDEYTKRRLMGFVVQAARTTLFSDDHAAGQCQWVEMTRAAYLSFAANIPAVAAASLKLAVESTQFEKWSPDWCTHVIRVLTFASGIKIYPGRYDKIRPMLESLWPEVTLPKTSAELRDWKSNEQIIPSYVFEFEDVQQAGPVDDAAAETAIVARAGFFASIVQFIVALIATIFGSKRETGTDEGEGRRTMQ